MGGSESKIVYQKDMAELFPAGSIDLNFACEVVKCTPPPVNTYEDFCNYNNNYNSNIYNLNFIFHLLFLIFIFIIILLIYNYK
jgi:hypothetical protein